MAKPKQPPAPEETLEELLDRVSDARETLVSVERTLERLRSDITALDKRKSTSRKTSLTDLPWQELGDRTKRAPCPKGPDQIPSLFFSSCSRAFLRSAVNRREF
jgi:hypothetical protein